MRKTHMPLTPTFRAGLLALALAILQHPQNPGYPSPWFTRDYGFLSPTPMFWPADGKDTRIAKGGKLRLCHRVLVFSGTAESAGVDERFAEFSVVWNDEAPPGGGDTQFSLQRGEMPAWEVPQILAKYRTIMDA